MEAQQITVEATVHAPVAIVWKAWNTPADIMQWNTADAGWHCPASENDLRVGGTFKNRMEAKDGSFGFDFEGEYETVEPHRQISYRMADGRKASTLFTAQNGSTNIVTTFDAESENDPALQQQGWQAILNNFVQYVEAGIKQ